MLFASADGDCLLLLLATQRFWQWAQEYVSWQSYKLANGLLLVLNSAVRPWSP